MYTKETVLKHENTFDYFMKFGNRYKQRHSQPTSRLKPTRYIYMLFWRWQHLFYSYIASMW